jgi:4-amino-4-deoxy-L-arabinose transferase-like glycosyltransferase
VLLAVSVCFLLCAAAVLSLTPPWEANDEPYHVINAETLVRGHMYHITPYNDGNLESIQAPLYYIVLAGYQHVTGEAAQNPILAFAPIADGQRHGNFLHNVPSDGLSQRFVDLLRLPSLLFGLLTVLLTYVAARRVTADRWTPVIAAAIVAGVPKFAFVSGVINNDNLSNFLGAAALAAGLLLLARRPTALRSLVLAGGGLGLLAGALVLSKVTAALLIPGLLIVLWLLARRGAEWLGMFGAFVLGAVAICGWWLV